MYQPHYHREDRTEVQHALINSPPLGLLISAGSAGIVANPIPFLLSSAAGPNGTLLAHMARANDQWQDLDGQPVLVVFHGPQAYVSPTYYASKRETGKVVPTWNYTMVQVRGVARIHTDAAWLDQQIGTLTNKLEGARSPSWAVGDAPRLYVDGLLRAIVGVEIEIASIEGKWKVSQNRQEADRRGVAIGLAELAPEMADLVKRYGGV